MSVAQLWKPVRRRLAAARHRAHRLPYAAAYRAAVAARAPLETQVRLTPLPWEPAVRWTDLDNLRVRAPIRAWVQARRGRWWFARELDRGLFYQATSVFEPCPEGHHLWHTHETIRELFLEGRPFRETPQYDDMRRALERGDDQRARRCRSLADIDAYFERLIRTFESMRDHGYRTQAEMGRSANDEIPLYVDADGSFVKLSGANHRTLLAELLEIRSVPVIVRGAHPEWVSKVSREIGSPPQRSFEEWTARAPSFRAGDTKLGDDQRITRRQYDGIRHGRATTEQAARPV